MKKIIVLYLLFYFIEDIACTDGFLSKFHQNGYKLKDIRTEMISYDKKYFEFFNIKTFKYNRTTTAHNITVRYKKDVRDEMQLLVQGSKLLSNEYRHFPLRFQINMKKAFEANLAGTLKFKDCGNLTSFYFYKDITYHICNFVVDYSYLPPLIPNGQFKMDIRFIYLDKSIAELHAFAEVYIPIDFSKI